MFASLLQLLTRRPAPDCERGFVEEVRVSDHLPPRNRRVERILLGCWLLIAAKCWLVVWLVEKYHMKFSAWWVTAPTVLFALLCTAVYFFRE